jgi:peptidoglycan/xylan/chitin deacetylase (PgdA/CDA1 family)
MSWDEIREMAQDPLVTIGAHTKDHYAIAKLSEEEVMDQMVGSADRIEHELGTRPAHFAYPYGDPGSAGPRDFVLAERAGFKTAVTTRKGMLFDGHRSHLTALPRVPERGLSVADLHGGLSFGRALCLVQWLSAGQRRLTCVSRAVASSG